MRRTLLAAVLALGGLAASAGTADAQFFAPAYSYGTAYNPWTGSYYSGGSSFIAPGVGYGGYTYSSPFGYSSSYGTTNVYGNSYYQGYGVNPWTGAGYSYNTQRFPYGYGRTYYRRW